MHPFITLNAQNFYSYLSFSIRQQQQKIVYYICEKYKKGAYTNS